MTGRTISSRQTFFMKFIFPAVWIGGFAIVTLSLFLGDTSAGAGDTKWWFLLVTALGTLFIYWFCIRLKRVTLDGNVLRISDYRREITVPLQDIEDVTELRWVNIHPVTIHFYRPTDFGSSVVFMPTFRLISWLSHPVVGELRRAAARARGMPAAPPT